jgi:hypothetical protein
MLFMIKTRHAEIPDWYNKYCEFEEADSANSKETNITIEKILIELKS